MAYFYTAAELVTKIKACDTAIEAAQTAQQYSYQQGPAGDFGVQKGDIDKIRKRRAELIDELNRYYPDEYPEDLSIQSHEVGYEAG